MTKNENHYTSEHHEELLDQHLGTSLHTPLRSDAFELSNEDKISQIADKFKDIMVLLGLDLNDDSLSGTPLRVAKMYVNEAFSGLNPLNKPEIRLFENKYEYKEMLIEKNIKVHSHCEHHFVPIIGKCHVAYFPGDTVVGLSKLNRIVRHYAKRPQVQERLTRQIAEALMEGLQTQHVAVYLEADHMCVKTRGVEDDQSSTVTMAFHGNFNSDDVKRSFLESFR
ncbi:MAG TPA: GTP cyclohydrolase I FolE [Cryomorphaceae bacterium]|jgi:GTP cyclohydrolase I|nr:GTP cyclohydrolase I FolE [Cryomorphaceae bacterium]